MKIKERKTIQEGLKKEKIKLKNSRKKLLFFIIIFIISLIVVIRGAIIYNGALLSIISILFSAIVLWNVFKSKNECKTKRTSIKYIKAMLNGKTDFNIK